MKEPLSEILQSYPLKVKKMTTITYKEKKGVWAIETDHGKKILKKFPGTRDRLNFILAAANYLRSRGIYIPAVVSTRSGADYVEAAGSCYVLNECVSGSTPSYDSPGELNEIMQTLGKFHKASRGFQTPMESKEREHLGKWEITYQKHLDALQEFKKLAGMDSSPFSKLFLKHADSFIEQGNKALNIIQSSDYSQWVEKIERQKNLCHQDFAAGNLIRTKKGIAVLDLDSLTFDLPARDLRKIFNKVMKKKGWNESTTVRMISAYHSVNPLSKREYEVLYADVLFPNLFYGIISKFYQKREKEWGSSKFMEKLNMVIQSEQSKERVLANWNGIINNMMNGKE